MARITVTPANEDEVIFAGISSEPQASGISAASEPAETAGVESTASESAAPTSAVGSVPGSAVMKNAAASASEGIDGADVSAGAQTTTVPSADSATDAHSAAASAAGGVAKSPNRSAASSKSKASDAYHETTLEDLEPTPMPLAQRIVIIAAVVCIIGALVYYFVAMR